MTSMDQLNRWLGCVREAVTVSQVIGATKDAGLIKAVESETTSTRYVRYLPFWAWRVLERKPDSSRNAYGCSNKINVLSA